MRDLTQLDQLTSPSSNAVDTALSPINSPLNVKAWERALSSHPDKSFIDYVTNGLRRGFHIGYNYERGQSLKSAKRNMLSAKQHPEVIQAYLEHEVQEGRVLGPFPLQYPTVHTSPFGVIPKRHQANKWRLILDLSHPEGSSVNDGIDPSLCSLQYTSVDDITTQILTTGRGTLMAKIDIKNAYRNIPVHPSDRHLLGMEWQHQLYVDGALPFGLRSAPKIFNTVADALEWILRHRGVKNVYHYLDDFIILGHPNSTECSQGLAILKHTCEELGLPLAVEKCEGPSTRLTFLGIIIDTVRMELQLPLDKIERLSLLLNQMTNRNSATKKELQSLAGCLQHAATVVKPGRTFLRRIFELIATLQQDHHRARLNKSFYADLEWWSTFMSGWNATSMFYRSRRVTPDVEFWSDASGSWGCGAIWQSQWLQIQWLSGSPIQKASIAAKEMLPIVLSCIVWRHAWWGCTVRCNCDNEAVVRVINSRYAKDPLLAHMLRSIFFISAKSNFDITAIHTPGRLNIVADAISRNNMSLFHAQVPHAATQPIPISIQIVKGLSSAEPDWSS